VAAAAAQEAKGRRFGFCPMRQCPGTEVGLYSTDLPSAVTDTDAAVCNSGLRHRDNSAGRPVVLRVDDCFSDVYNRQRNCSDSDFKEIQQSIMIAQSERISLYLGNEWAVFFCIRR